MKLTDSYRNMLAFIDSWINDLDLETDANTRNTVAASLFDVANEHGKAINTLFEEKLDASGFAMMRVQFDTFIRACWFKHCATDSEIKKFLDKDELIADDKRSLPFTVLLSEVEEKTQWGNTLSEIKLNSWKALNSYTHGGLLQVIRRTDGTTIEPHHTVEQVDECIKFSAMMTFLIFSQLIGLSNDKGYESVLENLYQTIEGWVF